MRNAVLYILEAVFCIFVVVVVVYQLIIPIAKRFATISFFREPRKLSKELSKVNEEIEDLKLKQEIDAGKRLIARSSKSSKQKS